MELIMERAYYKEGVNGTLFCSGHFLCFTIELPWKDNKRSISCIPEGCYELEYRFSAKFRHHLLVKGVENRQLILFHPANDALEELEGCIAPVIYLSGIGKGVQSRPAMQKLMSLIHQAKDRKEPILLTIKQTNHECHTTI
ncbi:MAG TPA: DUF5675 family protein [Mangrovimonas sp.]|nr:hypothetical protein [Mangrovimonas sp.]MCB0464421.1 hypothetical protein [Aequorivita sp.]HRV56186.1 DUF5675 family protein [Mangrovimonas sp.]